jgi:hypothetical protein
MRLRGLRRPLVFATAGAVLALGACSHDSGLSSRAEQERVAPAGSLKKQCSASLCTGERSGAPF